MFVGNNYNNGLNGNNNLNNNGRFVGIAQHIAKALSLMKSYDNLWKEVCSHENLRLAYKRARRHKTKKDYVVEFGKHLENNLLLCLLSTVVNSQIFARAAKALKNLMNIPPAFQDPRKR